VRVDDEIVAFAVAVGLGDGEAKSGGLVAEGEFGELSAAFGVELVKAGAGEGRLRLWLWVRRRLVRLCLCRL
jgi:hypothetical protein